jgi:hypothetical protein
MLSVKKELKIFRGTYAEVQAQTTEDMTIYLSWDTQEIFVGNKFGVKTPYIGGNRLTEREIRELFTSLTNGELELLRAQVVTINVTSNNALSTANAVNTRLDDLEEDLRDDIVEEILALTAPGGALNEVIYTRVETDARIAQVLLNYYLRSEIDAMFPEVPVGTTFAEDYISLKGIVTSLQSADSTFDSVKVLDVNVITENQLLSYTASIAVGLYTFRTSAGYEFLNKTSSSVIRIKHDGYTYRLVEGEWELVPTDFQVVKTVNGKTPTEVDNHTITLNADDIQSTANRVWNSILPQENGVVNPLGRNQSFSSGNDSVAFGSGSAAEGLRSISIGKDAVVSGTDSIQLGTSEGNNTEDNSLKVWGHKLLDKTTGKIPQDRIIERFYSASVTIETSEWNIVREVIKEIADITLDSLIWVTPAEQSYSAYSRSAIRGVAQANGSITFKCDVVPSEAITINIAWRN